MDYLLLVLSFCSTPPPHPPLTFSSYTISSTQSVRIMQGLETIIFMCWSVNLSSIELLHNPVLVIALYLKPYTLNLQLVVCACVCVHSHKSKTNVHAHCISWIYLYSNIALFSVHQTPQPDFTDWTVQQKQLFTRELSSNCVINISEIRSGVRLC